MTDDEIRTQNKPDGFKGSHEESWKTVVEEEEELARKVMAAIAAVKTERRNVRAPLEEFRALRDAAAHATEGDLPALIDQLHNMQSQARAIKKTTLPNPKEPYFAHMSLEFRGKVREILLGYDSFIEPKYGVSIIDWRNAPVAGVFFEYREGEVYEQEVAGRELVGRLAKRRIVAFEEGELVQIITPEGVAWREYDGPWRYRKGSAVPSLAGGAGGSLAKQIIGTGQAGRKLPRISALLDPVQHEAIHREDDRSLLVLGGAGCGKTTVALHRLAYLSYDDPKTYHPKKMAVVVPEPGLKSLTRHLLEELSMESVEVDTFDEWVWKQARRVFPGVRKLRLCKDTPPAVIRFKRHPAMRDVLHKYVEQLTEVIAERLQHKLPLHDQVGKVFMQAKGKNLAARLDATEKMILQKSHELVTVYPGGFGTKRFFGENGLDALEESDGPKESGSSGNSDFTEDTEKYVVERIKSVFKAERRRLNSPEKDRLSLFGDERLLETAVSLSEGKLTQSMAKAVLSHTKNQFGATAKQKYAHIAPEAMETIDGRSLDEGTPEEAAGTMDVEDLALLFHLHLLKTGRLTTPIGRPKRFTHMVTDEAQDLAPIELNLLGSTMRKEAHITVAGDHSQQIDPAACFVSWDQTLRDLKQEDHEKVELTISYRCTRPIAEFAFDILGDLKPDKTMKAPKEGAPVAFSCFANPGQRGVLLTEALVDLFEREPQANVALTAAGQETAKSLHSIISRRLPARLVLDGDFRFRPGLDVTEIAHIKGLEFDYVIIPDVSPQVYPDTPEARRRLHVAASRAIHQLWVICVAQPSPIIKPLLEKKTADIQELSATQLEKQK